MKNLNVKSVSPKEVAKQWKVNESMLPQTKELFIRCNSKGEVNWEVAPIYRKEELEERGNYTILITINIDEIIKSERPA